MDGGSDGDMRCGIWLFEADAQMHILARQLGNVDLISGSSHKSTRTECNPFNPVVVEWS